MSPSEQQIFAYDKNLKCIYYAGTIDEWNDIKKATEVYAAWNTSSSVNQIVCSDDSILL